MKVFLVLAALVSVVSASHYGGGGLGGIIAPAAGETGTSSQFREDDNAGGYNFGYDEQHTSGGSFRRESSDNYGTVTGLYGITDADGRQRTVHYVADASGFHAQIQTNEPGIEPSNPADVLINKAQAAVVAPAPVPIAAPVPVFQAGPIESAHGPAPIRAAPFGAGYGVAAPMVARFEPAPLAQTSYHVRQQPALPVAAAPIGPIQFPAVHVAPLPIATYNDAYAHPTPAEPLIVEPIDNTPRAFSYSFGSSHPAGSIIRAAPVYANQGGPHFPQQQQQLHQGY